MPAQKTDERSLGQLMAEMTRELSELFRKEIELAKVEARETAQRAGRAGAMFGAMAVIGMQALTLLSFALAWGLAEAMPAGVAFLIAGLVFVGVGALLFGRARDELKKVKPVPEQTIETLKEDVQWAKARMS